MTMASRSQSERVKLRIGGMDCVEEVAILKRVLAPHVDTEAIGFDTLKGVIEVPARTDLSAIVDAISKTGMSAEVLDDEQSQPPPGRSWRSVALVATSGLGVAGGFGLHAAIAGLESAVGSEGMGMVEHHVPMSAIVAYTVGIVAGLTKVLPKALYSARTLRPDMNLLMTLAVAGAVTIGEWFEAGTVSFLFALSLALESWSVGRARRAVEALMALAPSIVRLKRADGVVSVDAGQVAVGERMLVNPGERFGLDGVVIEGRTEVDQAPITGESVPVPKGPGDAVHAGTINGNGALEVETTAAADDTILARIVATVAEARMDRSDSERWVERFARVYTPVILGLALLVWLIPPTLFGASWDTWTYRALVFLVIGCPCALVISTPVAVVSGLAAAARAGVLVKGGRFLELPGKIAAVALDKTGTLTEGKPSVVDVVPESGHTVDELVSAAAAIESKSHHPLARAIVEYARQRGSDRVEATDVVNVPGKGTEGVVDGTRYWLGSHRWLEERELETPALHDQLERRSGAGRSVVVMGADDHVCGTLTLDDAVRQDAKRVVRALRGAGVEKVVMLTGDNAATAKAVGGQVGIDDVRAELLPSDKVACVEQLERDVGPVAMIGDGVNDAPALARASMGIAMGQMGTDVAIETADVALMTDDLGRLAWLIKHARRTLAVIRQNTIVALAVKAVFVALTFAGYASLWAAIAADMGASLLVVFNALRLLRRTPS